MWALCLIVMCISSLFHVFTFTLFYNLRMKTFCHFVAAVAVYVCSVAFFSACDGHKTVSTDAQPTAAQTASSDTSAASTLAAGGNADSTTAGWPLVQHNLNGEGETGNPILDTATYIPRPGKVLSGSLIALTFDDGPNTKITPIVLDILKKYGAHATFFCVGNCISDKTRPIMQRAVAEGNEIASHTWSHPFLTRISSEKRAEEMRKTSEAIYNAVGYYPAFYRPPYLDCSKKVLADINLPAISGSASDDWMTKKSPEDIVATVLKTVKPGAIYVMHDFVANNRTPVALETLIPRLQEMGYTLVTVSDLFASQGIKPEPHALYTSGNHVAKRADESKSSVKSDSTRTSKKGEKADSTRSSKKDEGRDSTRTAKHRSKSKKDREYASKSSSSRSSRHSSHSSQSHKSSSSHSSHSSHSHRSSHHSSRS